jgi:hypothetical protein
MATDKRHGTSQRRNGIPKPPKRRPPAPPRPQRHIPGFHPEATPS